MRVGGLPCILTGNKVQTGSPYQGKQRDPKTGSSITVNWFPPLLVHLLRVDGHGGKRDLLLEAVTQIITAFCDWLYFQTAIGFTIYKHKGCVNVW